jgi:hypothetical protein
MIVVTSAKVWSAECFNSVANPETSSRTNGTTASRMLNAIPPARKKMLSSPALSQTRFA